MNYVSVENLTKTFGLRVLFENISFSINEGEKIALVAKNGSGKTTLLKIIMQQEVADSGLININKDIRVVLFDQEIAYDPNNTVEEFMMNLPTAPIQALKNYHRALSSNHPNQMEKALAAMEIHKAWDLENEIKQILSQLKITNLQAKMGQLSGGQIKRVALAKLLTETKAEHKHTLLIMDEPTNHLDLDMVEWLERYLSMQNITLLLVTHDRYFLDAVCNTIWELENQQLYLHRGSYATYLENKAIREENLAATVDKAKNLYRRELEWMRRQPQARGTKSKSRIDAFYETEKVAKKNLEKSELNLDFEMQRLGKKILELQHLSKSYGDKVILKDFSYNFQRGEKIGIIGKNGVGKSTLLNIIQGLEPADSGSIETGTTISFGYFSQKGLDFPAEQRVIEFLKEKAEYYPLANGRTLSAAQFLRMFLFDDQIQYTPIAKLSGGEKRRLHLLSILYQNPNFLIFDEPTNDLDLPTLTVLENFLQQFEGCLIIVSHDRYFMDKIIDHVFVFKGEGIIKDFVGSFSEYRDFEKEQKRQAEQAEIAKSKANTQADAQPKPKTSKKLTYKEKLELEAIEKELPDLELQRDNLVAQLNNEQDYGKIALLSSSLEKVSQTLEEKEMRWFELNEKLEN